MLNILTKITSGMCIGLALLCGVLYFQNSMLSSKLDTANVTITAQSEKITQRDNKIKTLQHNQQLSDNYHKQLQELQSKVQSQNKLLDRYKSRQNVVFAKPELVQKLERSAWVKFFEEKE